jgi:hypothetical protein
MFEKMFQNIKLEDIDVGIKDGKLFFSYKLNSEDKQIKAAGRKALKKFPVSYDKDDEWILEGDYLILKISLKSDEVSLGIIKKMFEKMVL